MGNQATQVVTQSTSTLNIDPAVTPSWDITAAVATVGITLKASKFPTSNPVLTFTAILRQDGAGSRTFAWSPNVNFVGTAPQPGATTPVLVVMVSVDQGATWYCVSQSTLSASNVGALPLSGGQLTGVLFPVQETTVGAPAYVKGGLYYDTTLSKLRVGGATAWETVTSV